MQLTLKRARERRRLTKAQLAKKCGVDKSTVGRIEKGQVLPMHRTVTAMEAALELEPGTLKFQDEASR